MKRWSLFYPIAALLCAFSLCLPALCAVRQEAQLEADILPRPALAGTLDEQARELPIVYALYRRKALSEYVPYENVTDRDACTAQTALVRQQCAALRRACVLPGSVAEAAEALWDTAAPDVWAGEKRSFSGVQLRYGMDGPSVQLEQHNKTGLVVLLELALPTEGIHAEECLRLYRAYLGANALDDWQDVPLSDETHTACWSQKGQLYLYCTANDDRFLLGAMSLSIEDVGTQFPAPMESAD